MRQPGQQQCGNQESRRHTDPAGAICRLQRLVADGHDPLPGVGDPCRHLCRRDAGLAGDELDDMGPIIVGEFTSRHTPGDDPTDFLTAALHCPRGRGLLGAKRACR